VTDELIETGSFAVPDAIDSTHGTIQIVSWNINRGICFSEVLESLRTLNPDLLFLQEVDHGARRTGFRNISAEIAQALRMNYVFGSEFREVAEGSAHRAAFHGQATLCRSPVAGYKLIRFDYQSRFWQPRWFIPTWRYFQRRMGGRMSLMVRIEVRGTSLVTYNLHLESRAGAGLRLRQLRQVLLDVSSHAETVPVLIAGDFNCDLIRDPIPAGMAELKILPDPTSQAQVTTRSRWGGGRSLDWIVVRGPVQVVAGEVQRGHLASDHLPVSLTLQFP
jgi:endonuclease/exonuclease/phosphatase family metal-dependent hydrolase